VQWINLIKSNGSREVVNGCMLTLSSVCVYWRLDINVCLGVFYFALHEIMGRGIG